MFLTYLYNRFDKPRVSKKRKKFETIFKIIIEQFIQYNYLYKQIWMFTIGQIKCFARKVCEFERFWEQI
jgi:hypothetical protein